MSSSRQQPHDYVIVGAGSAGCVLANRLSADASVRVLLLEAGPPDRKREIAIPAAFSTLMRSEVDWNVTTAPQDALGGREVYHPRGKTLGGSSSINAQIYQRGHPADFDGWAAAGARGWSHADVLPYFERAEHDDRAAAKGRGEGGPVRVSGLRSPNAMSHAFVAAAEEAGIPPNADFNGARLDGVGMPRVTQKRGRRWSAADAYLRPAVRRPNLAVVTGARARRVVLDGTRASGVEYLRDGAVETAPVTREVLLCGGAFHSPQLLMLSGIGPAGSLEAVGIAPRHDLPGVGQNLQDHPLVVAKWACRRPISMLTAASAGNLLRYVLFRTGPLTSCVAEALAFVRSRPDLPAPDIEIVFAPVFYDVASPPTVHAFSVGAVALQPKSVGFVALRSGDPLAAPVVQPAYLTDAGGEDLRVLSYGLRLAQRIVMASALADHRGEALVPSRPLDTDDEVSTFVRDRLETIYHPVGTCRMGEDTLAVVDPDLRVRGLDGLRVADASVMPRIVCGHPNAAVLMIAEKAADIIRGCSAAAP
jgi:choline dehydrogenase